MEKPNLDTLAKDQMIICLDPKKKTSNKKFEITVEGFKNLEKNYPGKFEYLGIMGSKKAKGKNAQSAIPTTVVKGKPDTSKEGLQDNSKGSNDTSSSGNNSVADTAKGEGDEGGETEKDKKKLSAVDMIELIGAAETVAEVDGLMNEEKRTSVIAAADARKKFLLGETEKD